MTRYLLAFPASAASLKDFRTEIIQATNMSMFKEFELQTCTHSSNSSYKCHVQRIFDIKEKIPMILTAVLFYHITLA